MGIATVWVLAAVLALPVGQAAAYALAGHGAVWPGSSLGENLLGLIDGEPGRGLPQDLARDVPPSPLVYAMAVLVEVILAVGAIAALSWWWRSSGPYSQVGMASRREVADVLGRRALNKRRRTIRPDLGAKR